jgi:hypothetical protein
MKKIALLVVFSLILICCRKKGIDAEDKAGYVVVNGIVFNTCTDSGLANIKVYFLTFKEQKKVGEGSETVSDNGGNFKFPQMKIFEGDAYSYIIYIKTIGGDNAPQPEYTRFDGITIVIDKNDVSKFVTAKVTPGFFRCHTAYTSQVLDPNDSIHLKFQQKTFMKNVPDLPNAFYSASNGMAGTGTLTASNFPMGFYDITINKWRNGTHTISYDSIYLGMAEEKIKYINW